MRVEINGIDLKRQQREFMKLSAVLLYFFKINKQPVSQTCQEKEKENSSKIRNQCYN